MAHDHHDHSNCNHDHGHSHSHGDAKKAAAVTDEISQRQQAADKLAKVKFNGIGLEHVIYIIKLIMH